jgi:dodecin
VREAAAVLSCRLPSLKEETMDHVYPITEVYGSSSESVDDAIRNAVAAASESVRNIEWFEVTEIRGHVSRDGEIGHFQVGVKLGFRLERGGDRN